MNLLLPMFLYIGGIFMLGRIIFKFCAKTGDFFVKSLTSSSTQLIGDGGEKKSRAKTLDKKPLTNPDVTPQNNNNYMQTGASGIHDMKGVGYNTADQAGGGMPQAGGGMGVSAMIGAVNVVGLSSQTGNIANNLIAARQMVGGVQQQGNVISNKTKKGSKSINQNSVSMINEYNGRTAVNQNGDSTNTLTGKTSITSTGASNNYIYGSINRLNSASGDIKTRTLKRSFKN